MLAGLVALLVIAIAALVAVLGSGAGGPAVFGGVDRGVDEPRLDGEGLEPSAALANTAERAESERAVLDTDRDGSDPTTADVATIPWPKDGIDLVVVDAETGEPVPHALVRFVDPPLSALDRMDTQLSLLEQLDRDGSAIRCDAEGRVRVPYGTWEVVAQAEGRRGGADLTRHQPDETIEVRIHTLERLQVRVVDGLGRPAPDAAVVLSDPARGSWGQRVERRTSDSSGRVVFDFPDPAGAEDLEASLDGFFFSPAWVDPREEDAELVLPPHGSVVVDFGDARFIEGEPISLDLEWKGLVSTPSRVLPVKNGLVRFEPFQLGLQFHVLAPLGVELAEWGPFVGPTVQGETVLIHAQLAEPIAGMRGRVVDERGDPVGSVELVMARLGQAFAEPDQASRFTTAADGTFLAVLPKIPRNRGKLVLRDLAADGRSAPIELTGLGEDHVADLGTIVLRRDLVRVHGTVFGNGGTLEGASLTCAFSIPLDGSVSEEVGRTGLLLIERTGLEPAPGSFVAIDARVYSGENGEFSCSVPPDATAVYLVVTHPQHHGHMLASPLPAGHLRVVLEPDPVLRGRLSVPEWWGDTGRISIVSLEGTSRRVHSFTRSDIGRIAGRAPDPGEDSFLFHAPSFEPIGLELTTGRHGRVVADLGRYAPTLDTSVLHPDLDPLDLSTFVRLVEIAIEPPRTDTDAGASYLLWIEDADEDNWWSSAGATSGPWDAQVLLPIHHAGDLIVKSDRCRPARIPAGVERHAVQLELGPPVVLRLESLAQLPEGVRLAFELVVGLWTRELRPDDDGVVREHLAGPGPVQLRMTTYVPRLAEGEIRDPRWDRLNRYPLVLAAFDVGDEGVELDVAVPDLAGLMQLFDDAH
ncbi:hypothetical protein Pla163_17110 [Planctomycetes bacterium Pla163]|uniref:Uncharacterized protein n=2 Tax=Rohdeia mirabilis TaxID=2528008 RepID=A0A518CZE2_9BACT|nr:hypothetical protein Pla163_17110 [Planctomycetes bacterium Pla163]